VPDGWRSRILAQSMETLSMALDGRKSISGPFQIGRTIQDRENDARVRWIVFVPTFSMFLQTSSPEQIGLFVFVGQLTTTLKTR